MLIAVYGVLAYIVSLVTLAYTVGFVANLGVPKSIDGPAASAWPVALAVDLGLLALFGLQHSVMARGAFKDWWTRLVPPAAERSTYLLATCFVLGVVFWLWQPIDGYLWRLESPVARLAVHGLCASGVLLLVAAGFMIDHFELFGLRQALAGRAGYLSSSHLVTGGLYAWLRHPLMLGVLLIVWSAPGMSTGRAVFAGGMTAYILIGSWLEEHDLCARFGDAYRHYRQRTPMLLPRPPRRADTGQAVAVERAEP